MSAGLTLRPIRVLGHTVGPDLAFNLTHKVHVYNLVMWYTMVIQDKNIIADEDVRDLP